MRLIRADQVAAFLWNRCDSCDRVIIASKAGIEQNIFLLQWRDLTATVRRDLTRFLADSIGEEMQHLDEVAAS